MFATKKDLVRYIESTEYTLSKLQTGYWDLMDKHNLLLKHLGLSEHTTPETRELRTKGGPERGA